MKTIVKNTIRDPKDVGKEKLDQFILRKAIQWESSVKEIIRNHGAVDTGVMINSIFTDINENGFKGISSIEYMKYWEFGTSPHFVPFYGENGEEILASWGRRVLKLRPEEMKKMGGITVSTPELAPFRRSLAKL